MPLFIRVTWVLAFAMLEAIEVSGRAVINDQRIAVHVGHFRVAKPLPESRRVGVDRPGLLLRLGWLFRFRFGGLFVRLGGGRQRPLRLRFGLLPHVFAFGGKSIKPLQERSYLV